MTLQGKIAAVTGGSSGIGAAIAEALSAAGASVVIGYRSHPDEAESLASKITASGGRAVTVGSDVGTVAGVQAIVDAAVSNFGRLDVMVNNAGMESRTSVLETTEHVYDAVMAVNLKSAFFGVQLAAKQMIAQGGGGVIINTSSVHEDWPMPGTAPYCLSKGGMRMLARNGGVELAPHGVRVINVAPGAVATPINTVEMKPDTLAALDQDIPLGRMAQPSEVADVVAFLAGPGASYMTATTVVVDGGIMQQSPGL
jgi:glucose 1-dehydrogenase